MHGRISLKVGAVSTGAVIACATGVAIECATGVVIGAATGAAIDAATDAAIDVVTCACIGSASVGQCPATCVVRIQPGKAKEDHNLLDTYEGSATPLRAKDIITLDPHLPDDPSFTRLGNVTRKIKQRLTFMIFHPQSLYRNLDKG